VGKIELRLCFEMRVYVDPFASASVVDGLLTGVTALVQDQGWSYELIRRGWEGMSFLERYLIGEGGRLHTSLYCGLLTSYQTAMRDGYIIDNPHWDMVVTGSRLSARAGASVEYGVACGGKAIGSVTTGALLFSSRDFDGTGHVLARRQAILAGYQTASFLVEPARCGTADCIFNKGMKSADDMRVMLQAFEQHRRMPTCAQHHEHVANALPIEQYPSPWREPAGDRVH